MKKSIILTALLFILPTATFALTQSNSSNSPLSKGGWGGLNPISTDKNEALNLAQKLTNQELENLAKSVTVRVVGNGSKGSGTIIAKQENNYLILTNRHVVNLSDNFKIYTPDGQIHQGKLIGNFKQENLDLALLQITTNTNYKTAQLATELPTEGEQILSAGFAVETGNLNLISAQINEVIPKPFKKGYQIGFTGEVEMGMSGGAIFNSQGEIIGINGRRSYPILNTGFVYEDETKPSDNEIANYRTLNWGIPLTTFLSQMDNSFLIKIYLDRAFSYWRLGEYKKAITDYTQVINLDENYIEPYIFRGMVYIKWGQTEYDSLGKSEQAIEKFEKAITDYTQAINLDEDQIEAYYLRGSAYYQLGVFYQNLLGESEKAREKFEQAIPDYTQVINLDENYIRLYLFRAELYSQLRPYLVRAELYSQLGRYDEEIADRIKAVNILEYNLKNNLNVPSGFSGIYFGTGITYWELGKYQEAINYLTKAIDSGNNNFRDARFDDDPMINSGVRELTKNFYLDQVDEYYYYRCDANDKLEKYQEAIDDCTEAIKINPDYKEAYEVRDNAKEKMKR